MYLFYGTEEFLIDKEIEKLSKNQEFINRYDLENTLLEDIIEDANTISLFEEKKLIIVDNAYIFTGTTNKKLLEQNISCLENYLNHINPNTILIFKILKDKLDSRKKIVSLFKKNGIVKEFNGIDNLNDIVKKMFEPYKLNVELFINRVGKNLSLIEEEINKIKTYKNDDLNISDKEIIDLTHKNIDMDIFKLIDNIILDKKKEALECYNEMLKYGEESIAILILLANQIRIMYQSKELIKLGYTNYDIASILEIHEFRVKKALEKSRTYTSSKLLSYLEKLSDLDFNIKSGMIDKNLALELFILRI